MFTLIVLARVGLLLLSVLALAFAWRQQRTGLVRFDPNHVLVTLAVFGAASFSNFGAFHGPGFGLIHTGEMYTYFMSSKYFDELQYDGLYVATLAADAESPMPRLRDVKVARDLTTGEVVRTAELLPNNNVRERFTDARFAEFKRDLDYFLESGTPAHWKLVLRDHGYNAPPSRTLVLAAVAGTLGAATRTTIHAVAALDALLLTAMIVAVGMTFGLRVAALAIVLLGANSLSAYEWVGGSFLRQDWLASSVLGICALRAGKNATAGALLGFATMMRVFPGLLVGAVLLGAAVRLYRERRIEPETFRFAAGFAAATVVLGTASLLLFGGLAVWQEFLARITAHVGRTAANDIGLPTLLSGATSVLWISQAAVVAACAVAASRVHAAQAATLGIVLIYAFGVLSCYYYSLLVLPLLWQRLDTVAPASLARTAAVFAVPAVAGLFLAFSRARVPTFDARIFTASSLVLIAACLALLALAWHQNRSPAFGRT